LRFRGRQYDGTGVTIAVVDSGIQTEDPRLAQATVDGWTLELSATEHARVIPGFTDVHGHGTEIASLVHQEAPGARLLAIRVADSAMQTSPEVIAAAVESAYREGARVVNVSLGASDTGRARVLLESCARARLQGVVIVAAAHAMGEAAFPADLPTSLGILSHPECRQELFFLSPNRFSAEEFGHLSGAWVAPGYATDASGVPQEYLGAGAATARVSGRLACLAQAMPNAEVSDWVEQLRNIARIPEPEFGYS